MKFCPKCSLKINGNLTYCPLCKVELLSCADDEEVLSQTTDGEQPDSRVAELNTSISSADGSKSANSTSKLRESARGNNADTISHTANGADPKLRLRKLENHMNSLEEKLNLALRQDNIFRGTLTNMDSWIKKLDISLAEIKKSLASSPGYAQDSENASSSFESQIDQFTIELESVKKNMRGLHDKINKLSEECRISLKISEDNKNKIKHLTLSLQGPILSSEETHTQSTSSFCETEVPNEEIRFHSSEEEGLETDFEPSLPPLRNEDIPRSERIKKSNLPLIIILISATTIISLWYGFHFLNSYEKRIQQENITKEGDLASTLKSPTLVKELKKRKTKPTAEIYLEGKNRKTPEELKGNSPQSKKSASTTKAITKKESSNLEKSNTASPPPQNTNGYTINVGSFKDKERAHNFTKKLLEKGYPALMFPANQNKWYRVKIGAFSTLKEANSYAATFNKKENLPVFITKID